VTDTITISFKVELDDECYPHRFLNHLHSAVAQDYLAEAVDKELEGIWQGVFGSLAPDEFDGVEEHYTVTVDMIMLKLKSGKVDLRSLGDRQ
jgi:hypothetical protein